MAPERAFAAAGSGDASPLVRLRQSLALRLAIQYAFVFALCAALLFGALYWSLAEALDAREQAAVQGRATELAAIYERGGAGLLRARLDRDASSPARSFFVRVLRPNNDLVLVSVPPDWIETHVQRLPFPGFTITRPTYTVRIPQSALRDYAVATRELSDGNSLQVGHLIESQAVLFAPLRRAFTFVGAGALLLSFGVGIVLAWRATRPLRAVSDTARRILSTGDLAARVPGPAGTGELAVLVQQLNTLLDKNAAHVRVLRETLDHLAHDLRTPLTRLRGTAETAIQDAGDPVEARVALAGCVEETDRVLHLLETLLDVSAAEAGALKLNRERFDLRSLATRAADLYREVAEEKKIAIALDQPEAVPCLVDPIRLGQAVNNLLDNALKYTPAGGSVVLAVRRAAGGSELAVTDSGPGVPPGEREAIFRRLYRGDASRSQRGLGLGLSMVKAIVESHGGTVSVGDAPGGGARFVVRLPGC
ncbi:MAG: HAMP domain-containing protein [Verrucomicrobia bacterium]|nr:HAMP domain-containing protein [Verrucomicrobiota bacterium]